MFSMAILGIMVIFMWFLSKAGGGRHISIFNINQNWQKLNSILGFSAHIHWPYTSNWNWVGHAEYPTDVANLEKVRQWL